MAAKFFTGLPLDGPDPECVQGYGETALAGERLIPAASQDHSKTNPTRNQPVMLTLSRRPDGFTPPTTPPISACAENPPASFTPRRGTAFCLASPIPSAYRSTGGPTTCTLRLRRPTRAPTSARCRRSPPPAHSGPSVFR